MTVDEGGVGDLLAQMQELQQRLADAEAVAGAGGVEGTSGGGAVRIRASGDFSFTSVEIDPAVVDPGDVQLLEDLVLAAIRDAYGKAGRRAPQGDGNGGVERARGPARWCRRDQAERRATLGRHVRVDRRAR